MSRIAPRRVVASMAVVAWLALAAGCAGDAGPSKAEPADTSSATSSEPSSAEPSEEGVAPATGELITLGPVTLRVPKGFRVEPQGEDLVAAFGPASEKFAFGVQSTMREQSLDELAENPGSQFEGEPERLPDLMVDGVAMYQVRGQTPFGMSDAFGVNHESVSLYLNFTDPGSARHRTAWVEAVLASLEWS